MKLGLTEKFLTLKSVQKVSQAFLPVLASALKKTENREFFSQFTITMVAENTQALFIPRMAKTGTAPKRQSKLVLQEKAPKVSLHFSIMAFFVCIQEILQVTSATPIQPTVGKPGANT